MLIPNVGPHKLLPYVDQSIINKSENDHEERPFAVIAFLEDSRARTRHVYLTFGNADSFHMKDDKGNIDFFLEKNNDGHLASLLGGCFVNNHQEAFELVFPHILRIISQWCFKYKRPISIYETRVVDNRHQATWGIPYTSPSVVPIVEVQGATMAETTLTSLFAVFKEGMNSQSSGNRFLNYYKILEAYPNKGPFLETIKACKSKGVTNPRSVPVVTSELLIGAYEEEYHSIFIGKKFTWCKEHLRGLRDALAHPFLDEKGYLDLDSLTVQLHLSAYANLLERIAIKVLEEEFLLWGRLSDDPNYEVAARSYVGN